MQPIKLFFSAATIALVSGTLAAQTPATDPSTRLKQVLPAEVATRVLAVIEKARSRDLPADALENRALKFAARGVDPRAIEQSIAEQADRMTKVRDTLQRVRGRKPDADEVEAGAEALRKGADGAKVSALAKSAPSGRSLAVPFYVIGSLMDRGLPSDSALARVAAGLRARSTDRDLEALPNQLPSQAMGRGNKPAETGRDLAETKRPGAAAGAGQNGNGQGGPPQGVPQNAGAKGRPTTPGKPSTPPGKKP